MSGPKKSLGQHWLHDREVLKYIAGCADIQPGDTVLEIGPGQGTLTSVLLASARKVIAVEIDSELARKLPSQFPGKNLEVINQDILQFNLESLPAGYKVVANVPYYITSKIIRLLMTANNRPAVVVLLIQKEVAERLAAAPGDMGALSVGAQVYAAVVLGDVVPAGKFTPPPKVDSQIVVLHPRVNSVLGGLSDKDLFRVVKAGFGERRKKLRNSLAGGLTRSQKEIDDVLETLKLSPDVRAQELSIDDWLRLANALK